MIKKNKYYFLLLISFVCSSCSIKGSFQGLYGYYEKTKASKPNLLVKSTENTICDVQNVDIPKVYITNGKSLSQCLKLYKQAIVYIWAPRCKGQFCYPLNVLQQKCDEKNIELFIVAEYYDSELMDKTYKIRKPIFGIDTEYYDTNLTSRYLSKFIYDLTSSEKSDSRFLYFSDGILKETFDSIDRINAKM